MVRIKISTHIRITGDSEKEVQDTMDKYEAEGFMKTLGVKKVQNFNDPPFYTAGMVVNVLKLQE